MEAQPAITDRNALIARLADPTIGSVLLSGVNLMRIDNDELRARLVVVPQEPFLFAETIAYNLLFARPSAQASRDAPQGKIAGPSSCRP